MAVRVHFKAIGVKWGADSSGAHMPPVSSFYYLIEISTTQDFSSGYISFSVYRVNSLLQRSCAPLTHHHTHTVTNVHHEPPRTYTLCLTRHGQELTTCFIGTCAASHHHNVYLSTPRKMWVRIIRRSPWEGSKRQRLTLRVLCPFPTFAEWKAMQAWV